jgi:hypothetical protein
MSHGTLVTITFFADENYPTVSSIAGKHRARVVDLMIIKAGVKCAQDINGSNVRRVMELWEAAKYLRALEEGKVYVPEARYPNPPITYSTRVHHLIEDEFVELLQPFFTDLLESEAEDTPDNTDNIVLMFENEHGPLDVYMLHQADPGTDTYVMIEHRELEPLHHRT